MNDISSSSKGPKYILSSSGFQYVLMDTPSQVHIILSSYLEYIQRINSALAVDLIKVIFNLAISEDCRSYKLRNCSGHIAAILKQDFEQLGLVEFSQTDDSKFYITKYMQSFLHSHVGSNFGGASEGQQVKQAEGEDAQGLPINTISSSSDKFIIVETNFRVFAYTQNKLYKEILKIFLEPRREFPDMLYGVLTKNRVERAFKQQITANQIMNFLISHAHPEAIYIKQMKRISEKQQAKSEETKQQAENQEAQLGT